MISVLAGCGGSGGGSPAGRVNSTPAPVNTGISLDATFIKGVVEGAQCRLYPISDTGVLATQSVASTSTNALGVADFNDVLITGATLIVCNGGTYSDEATGETLIPPMLRAVFDAATNTAPVVSPLTEIAVLRSEQDPNGILSALSTHNITNALNIDVTAVIPTNLQTDITTDDAAGRYATFLAVVSQLAAMRGIDTPETLSMLITELADETVADAELSEAVAQLAGAAVAGNISAGAKDAIFEQLELTANVPGLLVINGNPIVGENLTATIRDENGFTLSAALYQWVADGEDISNATSATFEPTDTEVGSTLTVTATYTDHDNFPEHLVSTATAAVAERLIVTGWGSGDTVLPISCSSVVNSLSALEAAVSNDMQPGTTVCLADGVYSSAQALNFGGFGSLSNPITVTAENPGAAIISGTTSVQMAGEFVVLQGLVFREGDSRNSDLIQTRTSSRDFCHYCRISEISIVDMGTAISDSGKWLNIYGHHNRVDHNWFAGKANRGALLIINREADDSDPANTEIDYAQVDHNYFGDRPPADGKAYADGSDNDYEAIRTGTSDSHAYDSFSVFENNYFERIDGEAEVISNKAGNNRISNNTVRDSFGAITLRHGSSAVVANNFIIGDGHPFASGIRIIDDGHRVINNYVEGVRYLTTNFHGGIAIHNGNGSTTNGYQNVENVLIAHNTIVDSVNSLNFHAGRESRSPTRVFFVNNVVDDAVGHLITNADDGLPTDSVYAGNYVDATQFSDSDNLLSAAGFTKLDPALQKGDDGLYRPTSNSSANIPAAIVATGNFAPVEDDMDGQARSAETLSGADEISAAPTTTGMLDRRDVGPKRYVPPESRGYVIRYPISNSGFDNGAAGWSLTGSAAITNDANEVFARGASARIDDSAGRITQTLSIAAQTNYTLSAFTRGPVQLGVTLDGIDSSTVSENSKYRFERHQFNSGSNTTVAIFAGLAGLVTNKVEIRNSDFSGFGGVTDANWVVTEGVGIGKVQDTSNSASGADGAAKFRWQDNSTGGSPGITQLLENIEPNTDFTLSAYVLDKNDTGATLTIGVYAGSTTNVVASKELNYASLEASGAQSGDDSFLRDSFVFNSGSQTSLTLFVLYNSNESGGAELRLDDISLSYSGSAANGVEALVDEFRLVSSPR